jgi:IPT/TIG domain
MTPWNRARLAARRSPAFATVFAALALGVAAAAPDHATATTDFVGNPGFEVNLSGWNTSGSGSGVTLARVRGGHSGSWAAKLTNSSKTTATAALQDSPNWVSATTAGTYTGSIWVRSDTAGAVLKLGFQELSGGTLRGSQTAQASLTTTWQQVTVAYTVVAPGSTLDFRAYVLNAARKSTAFYADDASITASPPPTPTVSGFTPATGAAGTAVVISGTNLSATTAVTFNGLAAASFSADSSTQVTAVVPGAATSGPIGVTTPGGSAASVDSFTVIVPSALPYRYTFDNGSAAPTTASYGWNLADVGGKSEADALPAGMKGLVWVGDYDNTTCDWQVSDASLSATVQKMVGDPHVFGYFFSDEPYAETCPNAPAQHAARNALIKSIDPNATTVMLLNANGSSHRSVWPLWSTPTDADYIAIDPYPCLQGLDCDWSLVTKSIQAADAAGFRYWIAVQSFADFEYRFPTASELQYLLGLVSQSHAQGLMTFAWTYSGNCLCDHPDLLSVWSAYNHS